jgi:hypothetical protein
MEIALIGLGALAVWGAVAAVVAGRHDGYSRVPTRSR